MPTKLTQAPDIPVPSAPPVPETWGLEVLRVFYEAGRHDGERAAQAGP